MALWFSQLKSKNVDTRRKAVEELCAKPDLKLLKQALDDEDTDVRRLAATGLGKLREDACLEPLLQAVRDPQPEVQKAAIPGLKRFTLEKTVGALTPLLRSHDAGVRSAAAQTLETLLWRPARPEDEIWFFAARGLFSRLPAFGVDAIPPLEMILESASYSQCVSALQVLGQIDDSRVLRPIMRALKSADPAVVVAAVQALANAGGLQSVQQLAGLLTHKNGQVRLAAVEALGMLKAPNVAEPMRRLLKDEVWEVRRAAAEALGRIQDPAAIETLTRLLEDKDADVREATAVSLGMLADKRAIGPLVLALKDPNSGVRRVASASLMRIDQRWITGPEGQVALEALKPALKDNDPEVRHFVGNLLAGVGTTPQIPVSKVAEVPALDALERRRKLAVGLFLAILCDTDRDLRQAAAESLGQIGGGRAQAGLLRAVGDPDPDVRRAAEASLQALSKNHTVEAEAGNGAGSANLQATAE